MAGTPGPDGAVVDDLTMRILASAKYRGLDEALVRRVAVDAAHRFANRNQAVKYAKRKLHQAFGAFLNGSPAQAVARVVTSVRSGDADLRSAALSAMRSHVSSAERVEWLEPFYDQIETWCGSPSTVVDLACGLNPLAIPWMGLAPGAAYRGYEIDSRLVAALVALDEVMPVNLTAETCDLILAPPAVEADVVFLLKTVTTIEQQRAGATGRVLSALACRHLVVSLPRGSLTGRKAYSDDADRLVQESARDTPFRVVDQATFGNEALYHLIPDAG